MTASFASSSKEASCPLAMASAWKGSVLAPAGMQQPASRALVLVAHSEEGNTKPQAPTRLGKLVRVAVEQAPVDFSEEWMTVRSVAIEKTLILLAVF